MKRNQVILSRVLHRGPPRRQTICETAAGDKEVSRMTPLLRISLRGITTTSRIEPKCFAKASHESSQLSPRLMNLSAVRKKRRKRNHRNPLPIFFGPLCPTSVAIYRADLSPSFLLLHFPLPLPLLRFIDFHERANGYERGTLR